MKKLITSFFILSLFLAEPVLANITPNDPFYGNQWYLQKIKADSAWDKITGSPDIVIAVIDSGIDINHPDLKDNIWTNQKEIAGNGKDDDHNGFIDDIHGWDFVNNVPDPSPKFTAGYTEAGVSHGTMVAGIIAAEGNNGQGVVGVTWHAQIMALKALDDQGEGRTSDVVRAIDYAINNGADIINLSFVSFTYSEALQEAIQRAHDAGIIIVAAAGNDQASGEGYNIDKTPIYPACYDGDQGQNMVIGVAATDALDQKARFSSYGTHCVDLTAPGISFFNAITPGGSPGDPNRAYDGYWSGTSMAAPLVSGALALIEQANPELSRTEVVNILFASTDNTDRVNPDYPGELGNGRLNVDRAVSMAKEDLLSRIGRVIILPQSGTQPIKIDAANGDLVNVFPGSAKFPSGQSVATGDVDGDNQAEIIFGAGAKSDPTVSVYNRDGKLLKKFLAYPKTYRGGVNVAAADINNDNRAEIIVAPASGAGQIKIFDLTGHLLKQFAVSGASWKNGLNVATGDIDGNGQAEIVVGSGVGAKPQVMAYSATGALLASFSPYEAGFKGGVKVAVANINGRADHSRAEIITAPGRGRDPMVKIFNRQGQLIKQFLAYDKNWQGGMNLSAGDLNNDGIPEIAVGAMSGAAPHIRVFDGQGALTESFYAYDSAWNGGVNLAIIKLPN